MSFVPQTPYVQAQLQRRLQEGLRLHQAGQLSEAEDHYRFVLTQQPKHADALHYLGMIAYQAEYYDKAVDFISQSIQIRGNNSSAHSNLGNALAMLGRLEDAEESFRTALRLNPQFADAHYNLGNILHKQQKFDEAEASYRNAVAINPNHFAALNNLANVLNLQGRAEEAAQAYAYLGNVLQDLGRGQAAAQAYEQSVAILPNPGIEVQKSFLIPVVPMSEAEIDAGRRHLFNSMAALKEAGVRLEEPLRHATSALFYTGYHGRNDRELRESFADFYLSTHPELAWTAPHCVNYAGPGAKIRVGFVSKFLHPHHPIGKHYGAIMDKLDRSRFEVAAFHLGPPGSGRAVKDASLTELDDDLVSARESIAAARLDVLFYPDVGMDPTTYFLAFSRLAPVQCVTLGHPVTTGIPNMDYFLSADVLETADAADHYSEILIRMENISSYFKQRALSGKIPRRADFGLPADARLYACGQNPIKFHPEFDAVLAEILRRDPKGRLVLFNGHKTEQWGQQLMQRFRMSMPDVADRVLFLPYMELDAFLGFLQSTDAVLDTPHFSGGTTSFESFALGIPVVTWPGEYARSRPTYALYKQMNVLDLVAENGAQYVELALRLASDPAWKKQLQARLLKQRHVLYENIGAIRELERFFEASVAAATEGRKLQGWPV